MSCILKRSLECLTKNYLAKKERAHKKILSLTYGSSVQSSCIDYIILYSLSSILSDFVQIQKGKLNEKQDDEFCARFFLYDDRELFTRIHSSFSLWWSAATSSLFLKKRNMCNNTLHFRSLLPLWNAKELFFVASQTTESQNFSRGIFVECSNAQTLRFEHIIS